MRDTYSFGETLKSLRKRRNINQQFLADKLGVHRNTIGKWERGVCLPDSKSMVLELSRYMRLCEEETQLLLETSLTGISPYWYVPYQRNPYFTGREALLLTLHAHLHTPEAGTQCQSYALTGLGGVGKTQLALEYVYQHTLDYSAVFWCSAETQERFIFSFLALATYLQLPEAKENDYQATVDAVLRWLMLHKNWLLVFDSVEDLATLRPFIPTTSQGAVLLTTRLHALDGLAQTLNLLPLSTEEGILFLLRRANFVDASCSYEELPTDLREHARELVETMEGLPLALDQASAHIEQTGCSIQDFLHLFLTFPAKVLQERSIHTDHPLSVSKTLLLSFQHLQQKNPAAAELLTCCAFLAADAIPEGLLVSSASYLGPLLQELLGDLWRYHLAFKDLLAYSLIQRHTRTQTLSVHRLVQTILRDVYAEMRLIWADRLLHAINNAFPSQHQSQLTLEQLEWCEKLLPHALISINQSAASCTAMASVLIKIADYLLYYRGQSVEAEPLFRRALAIREQELGPIHPDTAQALNELGGLYREQARYQDAELLLLRALAICDQELGPVHPDTAQVLNELGLLCGYQAKYAEAEQCFQRSLAICDQIIDTCDLHIISPLGNLAVLFLRQGRYAEAEPLFLRARAICEQKLGSSHPRISIYLHHLAIIYHHQGKHNDAETLYLRSLALREQKLGPMHRYVATSLNGLARLYHDQNRYAEAEPLYQRALAIHEQRLGATHPDTAVSLRYLARLYTDCRKWAEAELLYRRALAICKMKLGPISPGAAANLDGLTHLYELQGKHKEALIFSQHALSIWQYLFGTEHAKTKTTQATCERLSILCAEKCS